MSSHARRVISPSSFRVFLFLALLLAGLTSLTSLTEAVYVTPGSKAAKAWLRAATPTPLSTPTPSPTPSSTTSCPTSRWSAEGNANDSNGLSPGSLKNGATFGPGTTGQAFVLDGVGAYVEAAVSKAEMNAPDSFTWEAWVNPTSLANKPVVFSKEASVLNRAGLQINPDGSLCSYMNSGPCTVISAPGVVPTCAFTKLTLLYDGATNSLVTYVNGAQVSSATVAAPYNNSAAFNIGWSPFGFGNTHFPGRIDEVTFSSCAVPPTASQSVVTGCACPASGWSAEGNASDSNGLNPGSLKNGATFGAGATGQAFSLDGVAAYVEAAINTAEMNSPVSFTWEACVNPSSLVNQPVVFSKEDSVPNRAGLQINSDGSLCSYMNSGSCAAISAPGLVATNKFTRVTLLYDGATDSLVTYVNGLQVTSATVAVPYNNSAAFNIGWSPFGSGNTHFPGLIDEVTFSSCVVLPTVSQGCGPTPTPTPSPSPTPAPSGFVIGDQNAVVGNQVTFWGAQWANKNLLSGGAAPSGFKGFANSANPNPANCGGTWSSDPGNTSGPPSSIPEFITVIVSSSITKSGNIVSGNIPKMAIVKTDPGYDPNPGHVGTGTVVAITCQSPP